MAETVTLDAIVSYEILTTQLDEVSAQVVSIGETSIGTQGPPGPPGDAGLPDAATLANGRMLAVLDGEYVDVPPPSGTGDMQSLIYDPSGVASDVYNAQNLIGFIDCGEF